MPDGIKLGFSFFHHLSSHHFSLNSSSLSSLLSPPASSPAPFPFPPAAHADTMVNMRKVTHQAISEELSHTVLLPCLFTLRSSSGPNSHEPPRIKWTKVWGQRGSDGLQKEQAVLVAKDNVVKVRKTQEVPPDQILTGSRRVLGADGQMCFLFVFTFFHSEKPSPFSVRC